MINKYSDVPLYSQLKNLIIKKIDIGEYPQDSKIPSEQELCEYYGISRPTVRQAVSELTSSGVLYKEKGKGTFVAKSKATIDIKNYSGFTDSIIDSQMPSDRNIISMNLIDNTKIPKLEDAFNIMKGQKNDFAEIKYLTKQDDMVFSLNVSYLPLSFFPTIIEDIKAQKPSYDIMRGKYPLLPVKSKSTMEIIFIEQSDAHYLQLQTGQALIKIDNVLYSKSGQPVEYIVSKYRADKCRLVFENTK